MNAKGAPILVILAMTAALWVIAPQPVAAADPAIVTDPDDPEMSAAIREARETLPLFWEAMKTAADASNFALKVAVPTEDGGAEHIWMNAPRRINDQRFAGVVGNEPVNARVRYGAPHYFTEDEISDWLFIRNGLIEGGYTIRALLPRMETGEAEALRAQLAPIQDL